MSTIRTRKIWLAALLLPVFAACGIGEASDVPDLEVVAVERGDLIVTASSTGVLEPVRTVEVTSKASGEIMRLHVDVGDEVEPGALLVEVDPRDVRNTADQADADIAVAEARMAIAERQAERSRELLESGVISAQEHESRTLEYANARASLIKAQTNSELAQLRLEDVTIRAPMAGTILEKNVEEGQVIQSSGQNVSSGTTLMVMANLDVVQVRVLLDEGDLGEIMEGMTTFVTVDAYPDQTFIGRVDQIEPQAVVQRSGTLFPLIVRLDNRARLLKPGMNTEVEIQTGEATGVLLIPNNSVVMPQDAEPAALTLGLDAESVNMESLMGSMFGSSGMGNMFAGGGRGGGSGAGGDHDAGAQRTAGGGQSQGGSDAQGGFEAFRARMPGGDGSQNFSRMQYGQAGQRGGMGGMREGGFGMGQYTRGSATGAVRTELAVVFVVGEDETIEPRMVTIGLTDWDRTQVVSGLEEGERVALIGLAQLQAQREEYLERMRSRGGNPFGGRMGGMGGFRGGSPH